MAAANPLEDFLNSDVDENAISALVGTLENKLASPTIKDPSGHGSAAPVNSNHIRESPVSSALSQHNPASVVASQPGVQRTNMSSVSLGLVPDPATNGGKVSISQTRVIGLNSLAATTANSPSLSTVGVTFTHAQPQSTNCLNIGHHSQAHDVKPVTFTVKSEPSVASTNTFHPKQVIVTVGSTNVGTMFARPINANVLANSVPNVHVKSSASVNVGNAVRPVANTNVVNNITSSAINYLANVAAEQQPLVVPSSKDQKPQVSTLSVSQQGLIPSMGGIPVTSQMRDVKPGQSFVVNVLGGSNVNKQQQQVVLKQEAQVPLQGQTTVQTLQHQHVKQEVKLVSQPQIVHQRPPLVHHQVVSSQQTTSSLTNAILKTTTLTPSTNVITINRPGLANTQTVTVLRPPVATQHAATVAQPQQTIQIVNSSNPRVTGTLANPKTLAPRVLTGAPIRIAPQQHSTVVPIRSAGPANMGTNIILPPGYQLPPGAMIVRNEQGHVVIMSQQQHPAPHSFAGKVPAGRLPASGTVTVSQTAPLGAPGVVSISQHGVAPHGAPTTHSAVAAAIRAPLSHVGLSAATAGATTVALTRPPVMSVTTGGSMAGRPGVQGSVVHTVTANSIAVGGPPPVSATSVIQGTTAQTTAPAVLPNQQQQQGILDCVRKCKNFLSTLLKLASASNQPPETVRNVKTLIQGLIDGHVQPEKFTEQLQKELKSSPQPYLVPFLKKSLPLLRQSLILKKMHIEGVKPPPLNTTAQVAAAPSVGSASSMAAALLSMQSSQAAVMTGIQPGQPGKAQARLQALAPGLPGLMHPNRMQMQGKMPPANQTKSLLTKGHITSASAAVAAASALGSSSGSHISSSKSSITLASAARAHGSTPSAVAGPHHKEKRKYEPLKDDDDINDVATMGGVNLSEESKNILATNSELMMGQLRSCKDETFLYTQPLLNKINAIVKKHGLEDVPSDVCSLISHATQERLRNVLEKLAVITEHRLEMYKTDPNYQVTREVRPQLKFLEELEKLEKKRKEEEEREVLLRVAKSRSKHEDPEQLKLKEKAKALQQAELAEVQQREANLTALAAIGPRKRRKLDETPGTSSSVTPTSGSASTSRTSVLRPRIKRVNLRDLIFLLEQERETTKSTLLYKSFLK